MGDAIPTAGGFFHERGPSRSVPTDGRQRFKTRSLVPGAGPVDGRNLGGIGRLPGDEPADGRGQVEGIAAAIDRSRCRQDVAEAAKGTPRAKASDSAPAVLTKDDEARRKRSSFLLPPGSSSQDRYDPDIESTDPPWRQTSFFGIRARGQFFIYVVDCSGSMIDDDRLARAKIELRRSVFALQPPQRFKVIFYNDQSTPMPGGPVPRPADPQSKDQLITWLRLIEPDGETDPSRHRPGPRPPPRRRVPALRRRVPRGDRRGGRRQNPRKVPIHCVDLTGGQAGDHLQRIARDSGGQYASRPGSLQGGP